jgi:cysteinyl-tRNA synthetase
MLRTHYRDPIDWTLEGLDESHKILWDWAGFLETENKSSSKTLPESVLIALSEDLNTPQMITELHSLRRAGDSSALRASLEFLGFTGSKLNLIRNATVPLRGVSATATVGNLTPSQTLSPPLLVNENILYSPTVSQIPALSGDELSALIAARNEARKARNFKESDRIRDELLAKGIVLKDGPTGTIWEVKR